MENAGTAFDTQGNPTPEYKALQDQAVHQATTGAEPGRMSQGDYAALREKMTEMVQDGTAFDAQGKPTAEFQALSEQQRAHQGALQEQATAVDVALDKAGIDAKNAPPEAAAIQ